MNKEKLRVITLGLFIIAIFGTTLFYAGLPTVNLVTGQAIDSGGVSIDISGLTNKEYNPGEEVNFKVILLRDGEAITEQITLSIHDALKKKEIKRTVTSNVQTSLKINNDFISGLWNIEASYNDVKVDRTFIVGANPQVEFSLEGDELTIRNIGNARYTKTIQIKIGDKTDSYTQNIAVGKEKILKLISADGIYDIEVTDGSSTLKREDVQLFGTGNVVGAVDKELVGYTGLAGADDPGSKEERFISLERLPIALIFIGAVAVLAILVIVERRLTKKKKG